MKKKQSHKTPHRCPICGGTGQVQAGFYNQFGGQWSTTSIAPETCRTCHGTGIVWEAPNFIKFY